MKTIARIEFAILLSACFLSACQPPQSGSVDDVGSIRVERAVPLKSESKMEEFPLPNCGGTDKLSQSLGMEVSVLKGIIVGAKASIAGGGEIAIPEAVKLTLEIKIEEAYQQEYRSATSRVDELAMSAAPGTHVVYVVLWEDYTYASSVAFVMEGSVYHG